MERVSSIVHSNDSLLKKKIGDRYVVLSIIGGGSFGVIYKAIDLQN